MEQFDSSAEESSKVSEQQQRNDELQCPSCAAELTEASVWMIAHCAYKFCDHCNFVFFCHWLWHIESLPLALAFGYKFLALTLVLILEGLGLVIAFLGLVLESQVLVNITSHSHCELWPQLVMMMIMKIIITVVLFSCEGWIERRR